jgi:high-affinity iron transporter
MNKRHLALGAVLILVMGLTACATVESPASGGTPSVTDIAAGVNSLIIIVREGLEAVLVIAVIMSYMKTTRRDPKYGRLVYLGVGAAILLSLVTWLLSTTLITITEENQAWIEGITNLVAVGMLFYCTNWLFHKAYVVDWMTFIKQEAGKALVTGSVLGLMALGFTVVYREGFETVLFYQTMLFSAAVAPVFVGFLAGTAILIGLAYAILKLSVHLPIRLFFTVTGALMLLLAFKFMGVGIHELQEVGLVAETKLSALIVAPVVTEIFGFYPTIETLVGQSALMVTIAITFALSHFSWKRTGAVTEST